MALTRRTFLAQTARAAGAVGVAGHLSMLSACSSPPIPSQEDLQWDPASLFFDISLAEWSLHRTIWYDGLDHLDFAAAARQEFGIRAVEYVTSFFNDKARDVAYLNTMKQRADDAGVEGVLVMVDMQGNLVAHDPVERTQALENHYAWIEAAQRLGCHSIRVNLPGKGTADTIAEYAIDSLGTLAEFAAPYDINVLVETHGGYSSNGAWLADVMTRIDLPNCGTLPDFGNFVLNLLPYRTYDPYQGTRELMPFAKGVSAKTRRFDETGHEATIDYYRMLQIVYDAGYTGHIGIEYEGSQLSEADGIRASMSLLIRAGQAVS